jgi:hypothetical protein
MFVALPRKIDTMLPRANLARVEQNRSGSLSRGKGISVSSVWISVVCSFSRECGEEFRSFRWYFFRGKMENEKCLALIQLYKSKEVLWNSKSANYHNKIIREDASINSRARLPRLDTGHEHSKKRMSLPRTNSYARPPRVIDTQPTSNQTQSEQTNRIL